MPLDIQAQKLLDAFLAENLPPVYQVPIEEARARLAKSLAYPGASQALFQMQNLAIPGPGGMISLRCYRPSPAKTLPTVIFFHGGGWALGNLDTHDHVCRALATQSGCLVVSVDYRLAPEHPFPAAIEDAWSAVSWVHEKADSLGVDGNRMAVAGDSAGGTLAAVSPSMRIITISGASFMTDRRWHGFSNRMLI